jgi:hypothetical protein
MATQSVHKDSKSGPVWPLGMIIVTTPGTPVGIMSLVDPNSYNAPETATAVEPAGAAQGDEYTSVFQQIMFQGFTSNGGTGVISNQGNVYIMRKGVQGAGNHTDFGSMVAVLAPGQTIFIASAPRNRDTFSGYQFYIDADNANDAAIVVGFVQ